MVLGKVGAIRATSGIFGSDAAGCLIFPACSRVKRPYLELEHKKGIPCQGLNALGLGGTGTSGEETRAISRPSQAIKSCRCSARLKSRGNG